MAKTADFKTVLEDLGVTIPANGQINCPFHPDNRPSMKLYSSSAYCFACHKHADVIEFVRELLELTFDDAVVYLLNNFKVVEPDDPEKVPALLPPREHLFGSIPRDLIIEASEFIDMVEFAYTSGQLSRTEAAKEILGKFEEWRNI